MQSFSTAYKNGGLCAYALYAPGRKKAAHFDLRDIKI